MLEKNDLALLQTMLDQQDERLQAGWQTMMDQRDERLQAGWQTMLDQQSERLRAEWKTVLEAEITPKLKLLAEGQEALLNRIVPVSRIEALESEVVVLKSAVSHLSEKVQTLEKAQ